MTKKTNQAPEATKVEAKEPKLTIGGVIATLLMDATLTYDTIVTAIHARFENASTSARSVASVAARLRKDGVDVPMRRKAKSVE